MSKTLTLVDRDGNPLVGSICVMTSGHKEVQDTNEFGEAQFPDVLLADESAWIIGAPLSGYYATWGTGMPEDGLIRCPELDLHPWWMDLLGLSGSAGGTNLVCIGVVDTAFGDPVNWDEIERGPGYALDELPGKPHHGRIIASLLSNRSCQPEGACPDVAVTVYAAATSDDPLSVDMEAATNGIVELTDAGADIISMSFGRDVDVDYGMRSAMEYATSRGVLLIAASGNTQGVTAKFPASDALVVGVGALASPGHLPDNSLTMLDVAGFDPSRLADVGEADLCIWPSSSLITDKDVVAPGVGIVINLNDDRVIEVMGTSFAAPLVAAVFAREMSRTENYKGGEYQAKISALHGLCEPHYEDVRFFGRGMPVLR